MRQMGILYTGLKKREEGIRCDQGKIRQETERTTRGGDLSPMIVCSGGEQGKTKHCRAENRYCLTHAGVPLFFRPVDFPRGHFMRNARLPRAMSDPLDDRSDGLYLIINSRNFLSITVSGYLKKPVERT